MGYLNYHDKTDEYQCNSLNLKLNNEFLSNKYKFNPDFNLIKNKENIECFTITGDGSFDDKFDKNIFHQFFNIKSLSLGFKFVDDLTDFFPKLEAFSAYSWKLNRFKNLGKSWSELKFLQLDGFFDNLNIFSERDLKRLFMQDSMVKDFNDYLLFPNLEALNLTFPRGGGDISKLSELKSLKYLHIDGGKNFTGWENFYSNSLLELDANHCPLVDLKSHFPNIERYAINFRMDNVKINPINQQVYNSEKIRMSWLTVDTQE